MSSIDKLVLMHYDLASTYNIFTCLKKEKSKKYILGVLIGALWIWAILRLLVQLFYRSVLIGFQYCV